MRERARASVVRGGAASVFALAGVLAAREASAHTVGLSSGEYTVRASRIDATLVFARGEVASVAPLVDANGDGHVSAAEVANARPQLRAKVLDRIVVSAGAAACPATLVDAAVTEQDGLVLRGRWECAAAPDRLELPLLDDLARGHRHVARVVAGAVTQDRVLDRDASSLDLPKAPGSAPPKAAEAPSAPESARPAPGFVALGVEHILTGWDHLLFLLGLVLLPARARSIAIAVTAFTVAHSITLALAVLGVWAPSPRIVEPLVALSVAWVGVESFRGTSGEDRWRLTLPFGLVHGFGFAGALRAVALPEANVPAALLAFNVGVELGQLGVLAVVLPLLAWLRKQAWFATRGVRVVAGAITLAGIAWFGVRVFGR